MWDNSTPLQLLKTMPKSLEREHLEKLQLLLAADKYKNQLLSGGDLCGSYAPFCDGCGKTGEYPCAVAYIKFIKSCGADVEISPDALVGGLEEDTSEQLSIVDGGICEETENGPEQATKEEAQEAAEETSQETAPPQPESKRIRIAIARKKTFI